MSQHAASYLFYIACGFLVAPTIAVVLSSITAKPSVLPGKESQNVTGDVSSH